MPFAIELFLDENTSEQVHDVWSDMARREIGVVLDGKAHITLGVWDDIDLPVAKQWLREFAESTEPFPVRFANIGFFSNSQTVVFLAPVVTQHLIDLQLRFRSEFQVLFGNSWSNYRPGWWVPHCTLALGVERPSFADALTLAREIRLPIEGSLDSIGIVEFPEIADHATFPLSAPSINDTN